MWNVALIVNKFFSLEFFYTTAGSGGSDFYQVCHTHQDRLGANKIVEIMQENNFLDFLSQLFLLLQEENLERRNLQHYSWIWTKFQNSKQISEFWRNIRILIKFPIDFNGKINCLCLLGFHLCLNFRLITFSPPTRCLLEHLVYDLYILAHLI